MNIAQAHYDLTLRVNKVSTAGNQNLFAHEIDRYLYRAMLEVIKMSYRFNPKVGSGFEHTQHATEILSPFAVKSEKVGSSSVVEIFPNGGVYEVNLNNLNNKHLFITEIRALINKDNCDKTVDVYLIQQDDVKTFYNQPSFKYGNVTGNFGDNRTNNSISSSLFLDATDKRGRKDFDIKLAYISYIRYPKYPWLGTYNLTEDLLPPTGSNNIYNIGDPAVDLEVNDLTAQSVLDFASRLILSEASQPISKNK